MIFGFIILSLGVLASLWYAWVVQRPDYDKPPIVKSSVFVFPFVLFYFSSMIVGIILIFRSSWKVGLIVTAILFLVKVCFHFAGSEKKFKRVMNVSYILAKQHNPNLSEKEIYRIVLSKRYPEGIPEVLEGMINDCENFDELANYVFYYETGEFPKLKEKDNFS